MIKVEKREVCTTTYVLELSSYAAMAVMKLCGQTSFNTCREKFGMSEAEADQATKLYGSLENAGLSYKN